MKENKFYVLRNHKLFVSVSLTPALKTALVSGTDTTFWKYGEPLPDPVGFIKTSATICYIGLFEDCVSLANCDMISHWDLSKVHRVKGLFKGCVNLKDLHGLSQWNMNSVVALEHMFYGCINLTDIIGISTWDTQAVQSVIGMFSQCSKLEEVQVLSNWKLPKLKSHRLIFNGCTKMDTYPSWYNAS